MYFAVEAALVVLEAFSPDDVVAAPGSAVTMLFGSLFLNELSLPMVDITFSEGVIGKKMKNSMSISVSITMQAQESSVILVDFWRSLKNPPTLFITKHAPLKQILACVKPNESIIYHKVRIVKV